MMGGPKFANYPVPNTLYTSQSTFQWDTWPIISLKPNCLKASKGRTEIGDTYPFSLFQSPVNLFDGLVSRGGGRRRLVISEKLTYFIFLCFCGNRPLDISYHATWRKTQYPLRVTYYFSIFHRFCHSQAQSQAWKALLSVCRRRPQTARSFSNSGLASQTRGFQAG